MPDRGRARLLFGGGQSNADGMAHGVVRRWFSTRHKTLNVYSLDGSETGTLDGCGMRFNDLVDENADYVSLIDFEQEERLRLSRGISGVTHHFTGSASPAQYGETIYPGMLDYLDRLDSDTTYIVVIAALADTDLSKLIEGSDVFENGRRMVRAAKRLALEAGYSSVICKDEQWQQGESDAAYPVYDINLAGHRDTTAARMKTDLGQTEEVWMDQVQMSAPPDNVVPLQQLGVTRLNGHIGVVCSTHFLAHDGYHRTAAASRLLGAYYGRAQWRRDQGLLPRGLVVKSATFVGNVITVKMDPAFSFVAPLRFATTAVVTQQTNQGWVYSDSTSSVSIVGVTADYDGIKLQMSGVPRGGSKTLTYRCNANRSGNVVDSCGASAGLVSGAVNTDVSADGDDLANWLMAGSVTVTEGIPSVATYRGQRVGAHVISYGR